MCASSSVQYNLSNITWVLLPGNKGTDNEFIAVIGGDTKCPLCYAKPKCIIYCWKAFEILFCSFFREREFDNCEMEISFGLVLNWSSLIYRMQIAYIVIFSALQCDVLVSGSARCISLSSFYLVCKCMLVNKVLHILGAKIMDHLEC